MNDGFSRNLKFDAYTYGIEDGGLRSKGDINMIICYTVSNCPSKLTGKIITDALVEGGIANYFEVADAISKIKERGLFTEDEEGYLTATAECKKLTDMIEKDLPLSVREKSIKYSAKLATIDLYKKENKVEITELEKSVDITMHITDKGTDYMVLKLNVPTRAQAELIKEKFIENPVKIYDNLINSIFE